MLMAVVVMMGARSAGISSLTPTQPCLRAGMPLALLMDLALVRFLSAAELRRCLVLPHLLRARVCPCILGLLPRASQHCAFIVWVCQGKVPPLWEKKGRKGGLCSFVGWTNAT